MGIFPVFPRLTNLVGSPIHLWIKWCCNTLAQFDEGFHLKMSFTSAFKSVKAQVTKRRAKSCYFLRVKKGQLTSTGLKRIRGWFILFVVPISILRNKKAASPFFIRHY